MRRTLKQLNQAVKSAKSSYHQALAYYNLGLFHDNNSREVEAIPNYEKAVSLGLDKKTKAEVLAWLASSLYKTDQPDQALRKVRQALAITDDKKLKKFLIGLKKRIEKSVHT